MKRPMILAAVLLTALPMLVRASADRTRCGDGKADLKITAVEHLPAGRFEWEPDRSPSGSLGILVSLPRQMLYVYRGKTLIARSSISSGRPGHTTPSGLFSILGKEVMHHSNLYDNAPMPWMQRLTMGGVALHAGYLPGKPASHGCIRLPPAFAKMLFDITSCGAPVLVVGKCGDIVQGAGTEMPSMLLAAMTSVPGVTPSALVNPPPQMIPVPPVKPGPGTPADIASAKPSPSPTFQQPSSLMKTMPQLEEEELTIRKDPHLDRVSRTQALLRVWSEQRALMGGR